MWFYLTFAEKVTAMRIKYRLVINGDATELPDDNIKNWDEVKCVLTRKNYEGVTRSISSKFEFVRGLRPNTGAMAEKRA